MIRHSLSGHLALNPAGAPSLTLQAPAPGAVRHAGYLCLSQGRPRFSEAGLAKLAQSQGDAAAWIDAFMRFGALAPTHAKGRFAVALVREHDATVFMAVDRFGTRPWCYAHSAERFAFAERADCVPSLAAEEGRRELDLQGLYDYLYFHVIPAPRTVFQGVQRLAAGHSLVWSRGELNLSPYWQPEFLEPARADFGALAERLRHELRASVERELGHGSTGAFLSGGTDSSTVVGMLQACSAERVAAYSIGFAADGYDEMAYAQMAARHFGVEHRTHYVTPDELVAAIPDVAAHYDQPFGNSSALPAFYCCRMAVGDGVRTLLAGDGGDELFGGNTRYAKQKVFDLYQRAPWPLRSSSTEALMQVGLARQLPLVRKASSYISQASTPMPDRLAAYNLLQRIGAERVLSPSLLARISREAPLTLQREIWQGLHAEGTVNHMLGFDWRFTLADTDLPKVIGTAALAGVEVAFPMLAEELIELSLSLPVRYKVRGQKLRWFFKEALRGFLPEAIIAKPKQGFGLPFGVWALQHSGLHALAQDSVRSLAARGVINEAFVTPLFDNLLPEHPGYYGEMVWIAMMMEQWMRRHAADFVLR